MSTCEYTEAFREPFYRKFDEEIQKIRGRVDGVLFGQTLDFIKRELGKEPRYKNREIYIEEYKKLEKKGKSVDEIIKSLTVDKLSDDERELLNDYVNDNPLDILRKTHPLVKLPNRMYSLLELMLIHHGINLDQCHPYGIHLRVKMSPDVCIVEEHGRLLSFLNETATAINNAMETGDLTCRGEILHDKCGGLVTDTRESRLKDYIAWATQSGYISNPHESVIKLREAKRIVKTSTGDGSSNKPIKQNRAHIQLAAKSIHDAGNELGIVLTLARAVDIFAWWFDVCYLNGVQTIYNKDGGEPKYGYEFRTVHDVLKETGLFNGRSKKASADKERKMILDKLRSNEKYLNVHKSICRYVRNAS